MTMQPQTMDMQRAEAFGEKMVGVLNQGALALMLSIGHRTGLFDTMNGAARMTSVELAKQAGLNERYVREWLGAMVTGGVVVYDPGDQTYRLPPEHAACLTRAAGSDNIAVTMQYLAVLGGVEDQVVECFKHGGGVPYSAYPRFHEVMAEESAGTTIAGMMDHILPMAPGLMERLRAGIDVLDVGCGSGRAINFLAQQFPKSRFTGYDFSEEAISRAWLGAEQMGLENVNFELRDVSQFDSDARFDLITAFDAIHDQTQPQQVLCNIHAALRPGGTFLMQDIRASSCVHHNMDSAIAPFVYTISCMHCMTVSLAGGGEGLGAAWGKELALEYLQRAGFSNVEVKELPHDIQNYYYVMTK
jgi:2-polyprenyl-3-methyl-5-hydroxy-6-metoxy-1,4-benzoquinol methylase